ncbi:MAG: hypothetical protein WC119_00830 [Synergistaceae bacterium]
MKVKCTVACVNANGEPDFHFVTVKCTQEQYDNGDHYDAAKQDAEKEGYEPFLAYDENDPLMSMTVWESMNVVEI